MAKLEGGMRLMEENRLVKHLSQEFDLDIGPPSLRLVTQVLSSPSSERLN
jgi:hypothetical protein